jgi:hypothetical protein
VTYELKLYNYWNSPALLEEPSIVDVLDSNLEFESWDFLGGNAGAPKPTFVEGNNSTGKTVLSWKWSGASAHSFNAGKYATVQLVAKVKSTTAPGSVTNTAYVIAKNPSTAITLYRCLTKVADTHDIDGDGDTGELVCASAPAIITAGSLASMESIKLVKGQLDPDWHKYPNWGKTSRAGTLRYRLTVKNTGNVSMTNVVVVDILPFVTDTGVIDLSQRDSAWQPLLIGAVNAGQGIKVYYSAEENPCRTEVLPTNPPNCKDPQWTQILPQDYATVRSLRFDFGDKVVEPGDELKLEWPMSAPVNAPLGTIAWNSFGYVATQVDNGDQLLPSEPIKVGIEVNDFEPATYGDYVWLDENKDGLQDESEIGLNGVRVELYQPGDDGKPNTKDDVRIYFTRTADGPDGKPGFYIFSSLKQGLYFAKFVLPVGYKVSPQDAANDDNLDSDVDPITHTTIVTDLGEEVNDDRWDMGLVEQGASLGNYVWFDRNEDGLQNESADNGINGVQVTLYRDNGDNTADPTSDEQVGESIFTKNDIDGQPGYYRFDDIEPGENYFVKFSKLPRNADGFTDQDATSAEPDSSDDKDSDPNSDGVTAITFLEKGEYDRSWDAGVIKLPSDLALGNRVWLDHNGDAIYNGGEKGINDVKVNLYWDADGNGEYTPDGDTPDEYVASMKTFTKNSVPGYYLFEELIEGDYIVQIDASNFLAGGPLANLISSKGAPDPDPAKDHDDNGKPMEDHGVVTSAVTLSNPADPNDEAAKRNLTVDFGFHEKMVLALGNRVWRDVDQDAYYDAPKEKGINDVTVNLYRDTLTGEPVASTQTADDEQGVAGYYLFKELTAGDYIVQIDPSNFSDDGPLAGLISSKGAPDPDPAKDHDDNGKPMEDNGVVALAVTLSNPADPTDEAAKRNLTVDFGFHEDKPLPPTECSDPNFYALHDDKLNDTQFFTIDPKTREVAELGPKYDGHDIEGMDMHPESKQLYATSGDDPGCIDPNADPKTCDRYPHGQLYTVDKSDGSIKAIGEPTGFGEISGISFNPSTNVLWAWADREGLLTIDINTGKGTWVFEDTESRYAVEALTWDNEGKVLYAAANRELLAWDTEKGEVYSICDKLPGQVEALDMAAGNVLLFAMNERSDLNINGWKIDGLTCPPAFEIEVKTPAYYDIEAITWPDDCDVEEEVSQESIITR